MTALRLGMLLEQGKIGRLQEGGGVRREDDLVGKARCSH